MDRIISYSTSPHLEKAISILDIDIDSPLHPDNIAKPNGLETSLLDYLAGYHDTIGSAWAISIMKVLASRIDRQAVDWVYRFGHYLSDIQILTDAVDDFVDDASKAKFNPLNLISGTNTDRITQGNSLLKARKFNARLELVQPPFNLHDPWRSLLVACLS